MYTDYDPNTRTILLKMFVKIATIPDIISEIHLNGGIETTRVLEGDNTRVSGPLV